jgi:hypothetical protein
MQSSGGKWWLSEAWHLTSWTHLIKQVLSNQTPCGTTKEVNASTIGVLISSELHEITDKVLAGADSQTMWHIPHGE